MSAISHLLQPCRIFTVATLALAAATPARATPYISNLASNDDAPANVTSGTWYAVNFTTDASSTSFELNSAVLKMAHIATPSNDFSVQLFSNNTNRPGSQLAIGAGPVNPDGPGNFTYNFSSVTLQPTTTYWLAAIEPTSNGANWGTANSNGATGPWTSAGWSFSTNLGSTWNPVLPGAPFLLFEINATAAYVPEPATFALLVGLPVLGLVLFRRRAYLVASLTSE